MYRGTSRGSRLTTNESFHGVITLLIREREHGAIFLNFFGGRASEIAPGLYKYNAWRVEISLFGRRGVRQERNRPDVV